MLSVTKKTTNKKNPKPNTPPHPPNKPTIFLFVEVIVDVSEGDQQAEIHATGVTRPGGSSPS